MRGNNFTSLIKDELVSRFESVVKNEISQYQKEKKYTDIEISNLRAEVGFLKEELRNSMNKMEAVCAFVSKSASEEKERLEKDFDEQRRCLRKNSQDIKEYIKSSEERLSQFIDRAKFYEFVSHVNMSISKINIDRDKDKSATFEALHDIEFKVKNAYHSDMVHHAIHIDRLMKSVSDFKSKMEEYHVNNEGFVRELLIYKKTISIIEKKIENLYSLVERAKKKNSQE